MKDKCMDANVKGNRSYVGKQGGTEREKTGK